MANEQRRPQDPNSPHTGNDPNRGGTGQGRESERQPMNPGSGTGSESERERKDRDRSRSGGMSDPSRGGTSSSDDRD
jgi:hypothetical protein